MRISDERERERERKLHISIEVKILVIKRNINYLEKEKGNIGIHFCIT